MASDPIHLGFWASLPPGFRILAPMEEVSDIVFRRIVAEAGGPQVSFTEFISVDKLLLGDREALRRLAKGPKEGPIVAQIWGNRPEGYRRVAGLIAESGFHGIDINMGCPQAKITRKGACAALINNPGLAAELIAALKQGIEESGSRLPLSVKTRIGFDRPRTEEWCGFLLEQKISVLSVHGRTASQMSEGQADWREISRVVSLRDSMDIDTLIVGNGDIVNSRQLDSYVRRFGVDGLMVGRGIFENLFLFRGSGQGGPSFGELQAAERVAWALRHLAYYRDFYGQDRNYQIMKKFFKVYLAYEGADRIREEIMETENYDQAEAILKRQLEAAVET